MLRDGMWAGWRGGDYRVGFISGDPDHVSLSHNGATRRVPIGDITAIYSIATTAKFRGFLCAVRSIGDEDTLLLAWADPRTGAEAYGFAPSGNLYDENERVLWVPRDAVTDYTEERTDVDPGPYLAKAA